MNIDFIDAACIFFCVCFLIDFYQLFLRWRDRVCGLDDKDDDI